MSWIRKHPLLSIAALAFALRAAAAVVTELNPIFPAYYYTDVRLADAQARAGLDAVRNGAPPVLSGPLGARLTLLMTLDCYRIFGPKALSVKLVNAVLGSAGIALMVAALALAFTWPAAVATGIALALWPSHVFYTSQNLKESPTHACAFLGLAGAFTLGLRLPPTGPRRAAFAAAAVMGLLGAGLFRSFVLLCLSSALIAAFSFEAARRRPRGAALAAVAAAAAALVVFPLVSSGLYGTLQNQGEGTASFQFSRPGLLPPSAVRPSGTVAFRATPQGLSDFRSARQDADRQWAAGEMQREIATQIFPKAEFHSWLDVLAFIPKSAFYVLFMPLPGLYPTDGKVGRIAASAENLLLLTLACFAAAGIFRGPRNPGRTAILIYFMAMTTGAALLEFDLGSAGRHKLLYLPMLFPFAAEELFRLLGRKEPA